MDDDQLLRYSRHILIDELGIEAQQRFLGAHVIIIGAGGLGSPAAMYLASAGVGKLTLVDDDVVDLTNLQRQIVHGTTSVGRSKVESARDTIARLNPGVKVNAVAAYVDGEWLNASIEGASVVLDCTDNFATRHATNRACLTHRVPLISGAALRFDGQITTFDFRDEKSPCYACVFPEEAKAEEVACATMGVFSPAVGVIGTMQAAEALRAIARVGTLLVGRLMLFDSLRMEWNSIRVQQHSDCPVCSVRRHR
jgi:molybdopterin/thiamine biosynthesis adenylyltransferase